MALASALFLSACSAVGIRTVEEPPYTEVAQVNGVVIRSYHARLAAEAVETGSEMAARSSGFRRVAGYIFGANHTRSSIAMTAPVAQSGGARQIAMTAPVDQAQTTEGLWRIRFFMPASFTLDTLPAPDDPRVKIVTIPAETVAVLRYSGLPTTRAGDTAAKALLAALDGTPWHATGAPMAWFYDPPWTIPPLRRNEAAITVEP